MLKIEHLEKTYGQVEAVADISFEVGPGEIVGLLGPNGAGKTTLFTMVLGVLEPTAGTIYIDGVELGASRSVALSRTNFAAVYAQLPGNMTVRQNLRVFGMLYRVQSLASKIDEVMQEFDIAQFRDTKCGLLSSGEQTRVGLAKAFLSSPKLLLLDEPTASLDPSSAQLVRARIQAYVASGERSVLWTSHNMHEVAEVCDRVIFLSHGKTLLEGDPKTLPRLHGKEDLDALFIAVAREPLAVAAGEALSLE